FRDVVVAHHGNFIGYYRASPRSREAIRKSLGIPSDAHVVLAFGLVRPYKRVPDLIEAFRSIDRSDFRLLIVGEPTVPEEGRDVEAAAAGDPRIILILERVPDDRVRELYDAADVAALAYRDVFSSSALLLALSCCVPVIAPENSTASELAPPPAVQPYRPGDLAGALVRSAGMPESARDSALRAAQRYEWDELACAVLHGHGGSLD
ncbi:MAG: glycosyltransferase, partial [Thermoleophilaceae bacterium]